jgi:DNA polymerase-3 subunit gamma/tau
VQLAYQIAVAGRNELHLAPDAQDGFTMTLLRLFAFRPAETAGGGKKPPASPGGPVKSRVPPVESAGSAGSAGKPRPAPETRAPLIAPSASPGAAGDPPDWHTLLAALNLSGMARELGQHCGLKSVDERRIVLILSPVHRHLQMKAAQDKLAEALSGHFGRPLQMAIEVAEISGETPAAVAQRQRLELQEQAVASVEQDAFVREAIDLFDATVIESSIKPV